MQAFSYLQRNIADKKYITLTVIGFVCLLYGALTSINPYLPPLFGVLLALVYFVPRREMLVFSMVYLLIFEADRGYYLFSSWLFLFAYIYYFLPFVERFVDCRRCIAAIAAFAAYPLYFLFLSLISAFFMLPSIEISIEPLIVYIVCETLFAFSLE